MAYCSKCGEKLEEGDIYCPNCGTKNIELDDNINIKSKNTQAINVNANFKIIANILIGMFLKPITTAKKFINETKKDIVIILTAFLVIIQGLLGIWRVSQIVLSINNIIENITQKIVEIVNLIQPGNSSNVISSNEMNDLTNEIDKIKSFIKIPYGEIFLQNCALILISILIIFITICVASTLLSKKTPQKFKYYKTALIITVPTLYFEFFSIIFSYLSINLGLVFSLFGLIVSLICFAMVINESLVVPENYILFIVSITSLINIVVLVLCFKEFMPSIISSIVSSIINDIKNLNI